MVDLGKLLPLNIGKYASAGELFTHLVAPAFSIAGTAVFIYMVIAAYKWVSSGGEKEAIASARAMITHSIIAFALLVFMFVFVEYILKAFLLNLVIVGP